MLRNLILSLLMALPFGIGAQTFSIDNGHSAVLTSVHRFGMVDVVGRFNEVTGTLQYDEDPTKMQCTLVIKSDSYTSNNAGGEGAVKSAAFLDANQYPDIQFESTGVRLKDGQLIATGTLTLHGISNEISFPIELMPPFKDPTGKTTVAFSAELTINRQDYGISFDRKMINGKPLVADEIHISIDILVV